MEWSGFKNIMKEDSGFKTGYKYVANLAQRIAYNLGNTPSQTEVKIISCIPIDVSELHKTIYRLERQLEQAVREKKVAERALKSHRTPAITPVPAVVVPIHHEKIDCKCYTVPASNSCQDPIKDNAKDQSKRYRASSCEDPSKHAKTKRNRTKFKYHKQPFYKSFESFYKDSGKGCHGEPESHRTEGACDVKRLESSMIKTRRVSNSDYSKITEPIQCCHIKSDVDYCQNDYQDVVCNKDNQEHLIKKSAEKNISGQHYLQPITEFCRLEQTMAFHRIKSSSILLRDVDLSKDNIQMMPSSIHKQIPEIRTVSTTYDLNSMDGNETNNKQVVSTRNCEERKFKNLVGATYMQNDSIIFPNQPTELNIVCKESQQTTISETHFKEISPESLGLPNTEPMRNETEPLLSFVRNNQTTQAPSIDSCSCCFFKQLKAEDLLLMPRGPLRRHRRDSEQTSTSTECTDFRSKTQKIRNVLKFPKQARGIGAKQDRITNSFIEGMVSKYHAHSTMQSSSSEYSAPVCHDVDSESCSCCAGVFYDIDLLHPQTQHFIKSSSSNQQYYDDTQYDLIPVKEKSKRTRKEKSEVNKFSRQTSPIAINEVIVNYHTVEHQESKKVTNTKSKLTSRSNATQNKNMLVTSNKNTEIPHSINSKKLVSSSNNHIACQTELVTETADGLQGHKDEDALSEIKQTLQVVLDKFKLHPQIEQIKKDAVLQVGSCQCELYDRNPFHCVTNPCQTNPRFMHCSAQLTGPFIYPAILAPPYCPELPMFIPSKTKRNNHSQKTKSKCKSSFVGGRSSLQKRTSRIPEAEEFSGDIGTPNQVLRGGHAAAGNTESVETASRKKIDVSGQTGGQSNLVNEPVVHAIIISNTNITKKHKNKKINCCLSKKHNVKSLKTVNNKNENDYKNKGNVATYFNDTGSTVRQVIKELENMEQYINNSEIKIGDIKSSRGSVDKPKRKLVELFRNIKKVFKSRSKHGEKIDKRMSLDNIGVQQAKRFRLPSVHLIYPPKQKFPFSRKQHNSGYSPLMTERYSYTDLHSKKCRDHVSNIRKRRSKGLKL